jgi:hypothetical protein
MDKLSILMDEVNLEIEAMKDINPVMGLGMSVIKGMIERLQDVSDDNPVVVTVTVDEKVGDLLADFSRHLLNTLTTHVNGLMDLDARQSKPRQVPAEFMRLISPDALQATMNSLDLAISVEAGASDAKEASYGNKGDLLRQKAQLDTSIKLTEAEAFGKVQGEGKAQYVNVAGEKLYLTNDTARDAYRRMESKLDREELAKVNGELGRLEVAQFKATDAWYGAKGVADNIGKKADLQAALLNFLAGRG